MKKNIVKGLVVFGILAFVMGGLAIASTPKTEVATTWGAIKCKYHDSCGKKKEGIAATRATTWGAIKCKYHASCAKKKGG